MENRESYYGRMKKALDELNEKISALESKIKEAAADLSVKYKPELDELKKLRRQVEEKLQEFRDPAKTAFKDIIAGFDKAASELNSALRKAYSRFNEDKSNGT